MNLSLQKRCACWIASILLFLPGIQELVAQDSTVRENTPARPNVLLLLADDMGYADLHCYGGASQTPHLDRLAAGGLRFNQFYAAAPNCSPSRAGLLTGRSPARLGMYSYRPPNHPMHLRAEEITLAELLAEQGYQTLHLGKWHLGCLPQNDALNHPQPDDQGFQYSLGTENNARPSHLNPNNFVRNGEPQDPIGGYSCQILADEWETWLEDRRDPERPFLAYLAFHEPHAKIASPPELIAHYPDVPKRDAEYLANVENLDLAIGRVLESLQQRDLMDDTLILFASDNGSYRQASNGSLRAVKSYLYDGGIRVPGIFYWKDRIQPAVAEEPAGFVDVVPTVCDLMQIALPGDRVIDGTSLKPLLSGSSLERQRPLYWFFYRTSPEIAVRQGPYMVLGRDDDTEPRTHRFTAPDMDYIRSLTLQTCEVYNVVQDPGQYQDLYRELPEAAALEQQVKQQLSEIQKTGPFWDNLPAADGQKRLKTDWMKYQR